MDISLIKEMLKWSDVRDAKSGLLSQQGREARELVAYLVLPWMDARAPPQASDVDDGYFEGMAMGDTKRARFADDA